MEPKFEPTDDGLEIIDPIERHRCRLTTHEPVTPKPVDCDRIEYPVTSAVEITAEMLTLPTKTVIYVRNTDGKMLDEVQPNEQRFLSRDNYILDLSTSLKTYAKLETSVQVYSDADRTYLSFEGPTVLTLGARSYHTRPAHTITTTAEPTDVMKAVSAFGSALKVMTVERSYPTLRGHPPALERGPKLDIPDEIERPQTGVRIEVPPELGNICVVTPLAYYLGASVTPGTEPKLVTETGYSYPLDADGGFERTVERTLKQLFLLDCVVRSEGSTPLPLHERTIVEPLLSFELEDAYGQPLTEQLELYLEVPTSSLESQLPHWQLETQIDSPADAIEFLPFLAYDLSTVTIASNDHDSKQKPRETSQTAAIEAFTRGTNIRNGASVRGSTTASGPNEEPTTPTVQQYWRGRDSSPITSTTPVAAFHNDIGRTSKEGPIAIDVICNDSEMDEELELVHDIYGTHQDLPLDVTIHHNLTKRELESVFMKESDFCHYIGHIDADGFQCSNGKFNAKSLDATGTKAFLLNACQSHDQGLYLIEAGSIGGVVTFGNVVNGGAIGVGCAIARLLNVGFPLYAALDIARETSLTGNQYTIVGNGHTTISQSKRKVPILYLDSNDTRRRSSQSTFELLTYVGSASTKGGVFTPAIDSVGSYYLVPGKTEQMTVTALERDRFFSLENVPILSDGNLFWSENYTT